MKKLEDVLKEKINFNKINFESVTIGTLVDYWYKDNIISILKKEPIKLFEMIFPYISKTTMVKEVNINCDDLNNGSYNTYRIYDTINLDNFYKITDIDVCNTGIIEIIDGKETLESYYNVDLEFKEASYNIYSRKVVLKGTYVGDGRGIYSLDWCDVGVELLVRGISNETEVPSWCEYLLEGLCNIQYENYKMAFFNICAAFDNFINEIYDDIFHYYLVHYSETTNMNIKYEDEEKIREFSNKEKRLRNKLYRILRELKIDNKHGFSKIQTIVDVWDKKYIKERDKIAHGGKYTNSFEIEDVVYNIMTIILTILLHVDMCDNQWENSLE